MTIDEQLNLLEDWIRRLKVEYEIFFAGGRRKPPYDLRSRVETTIKRLLDEKDLTYAQRFRYNTLVARYNTYRRLWGRTQEAREEGRIAAAQLTPEPSTLQAEELSYQVSLSDPEMEEGNIRQLYNFLLNARKQLGEKGPPPSYDNFRNFVVTKTNQLKAQLGCQIVRFNISVKGKQLRLTAKVG